MVSSSFKLPLYKNKLLVAIFTLLLIPNNFDSFIVQVRARRGGSEAIIVKGLSWNFYKKSCPKLESIIRNHLKTVLKPDIAEAAGFLHLYLQDCFVQGCDASILLRGSPVLRALTLKAINDLGNIVHKKCGRIVSCADIITISTRDAIFLAGGPDYSVPLGRRDSLVSLPPPKNTTKLHFPPPSSNTTTNLNYFAQHNFDATDVVAISGSHTFGRSRCVAVKSRLYPKVDPTMDPKFAKTVGKTCDRSNSTNNVTMLMDTTTPKIFDNKYYVNIMKHKVLFNTDQDLLHDKRTKDIVTSFAKNQSLFFEKFVIAIVKMGQIGVLIGNQGEIRSNCTVIDR